VRFVGYFAGITEHLDLQVGFDHPQVGHRRVEDVGVNRESAYFIGSGLGQSGPNVDNKDKWFI
jgi:hypothetical protein